MLKIIEIFCFEIKYQKHKYRDISSYFSCLSQAHYPFISPQNTAPAQSTLRPISPNINNTSSSSSSIQIIPFNNETRITFGLMLEGSRDSSREHLSIAERQQMIDWIIDTVPRRPLTEREAKRKSWTRSNFHYGNQKLWRNPDKNHPEPREVLAEPEIFDAIITIHNSIGHTGQDATAKNVNNTYYGVSCEEVVFLIKLYEICHRKASSKSKGSLKPIISTKLFKRVQIDLIDMRSTLDITANGTYKWRAHLVCYMSKVRMLFTLPNKEAATMAQAVNQWICIFGAMDILQSDNGSEFKGVCLELVKSFGVRVING